MSRVLRARPSGGWVTEWSCPTCGGVLCRKGEPCSEGQGRVWRHRKSGREVFGYNDGPDGLWLSEGDDVGYAWNATEWEAA